MGDRAIRFWSWLNTAPAEPITETRAALDSFGNSVLPPSRQDTIGVTVDQALSLPTVARAVNILSGAVAQLDIEAWRGNEQLPLNTLPESLLRQPNISSTRRKFLKRSAFNLAAYGNDFWLITRNNKGQVSNLDVLNPAAVFVRYENGRKIYGYGQKEYTADQVFHLRANEVPGKDLGVGPLQLHGVSLGGAMAVSNFGGKWFKESGTPTGVLTIPEDLTAEEAAAHKAAWHKSQEERSIAVLSRNMKYEPVILNPEEAQWLESQKFNRQEIATMFGVPAIWLNAEMGGTMPYTNMEQVGIDFVRYTLIPNYLGEIEAAFSYLLPRGTEARFNISGLLRPDSKTRAEIAQIQINAGIRTADEIRAEENLPPLNAPEQSDEPPADEPPAAAAVPAGKGK